MNQVLAYLGKKKRKIVGVILDYLVGNKIMNCLWKWNQNDVGDLNSAVSLFLLVSSYILLYFKREILSLIT